ncbi:exodeoxyribonuclease VII large subunit [Cnuella takakiae]|nr:exodeoxyribonuclease VII large subunit [Cnuella takakiae]
MQTKALKLSELTGSIERMFQKYFDGKHFWVVADVTDHKHYPAKDHRYLALVEKKEGSNDIVAKISAVAWKAGSSRIKEFERITGQKFKDGINVMVKVSVNYQSAYGLKLTIVDISPEYTIGVLEQQRQETLRRLLAECTGYIKKVGNEYITSNKSLPYNAVLQRLAVVTSSSSAGYQDFQHTLDANTFGYRFTIDRYFTPVQGEASGIEICSKLDEIVGAQVAYDAVIIIRGGGAQTDFLVFDQFELCRRVAKLPFPVITGIGHQKDETIADLLAKTSTKTPTKAAEFIIAHNRHFEEAMLAFRNNILIKAQAMLAANNRAMNSFNAIVVNKAKDVIARQKEAHTRFNQIVVNKSKEMLLHRRSDLIHLSNQFISQPKIIVAGKNGDLKNIGDNLKVNIRKLFINQRGYLGHFDSVCRLMSPLNILNKGFAIIYHKDQIVANAGNVPLGTEIKIRMASAEIIANTKTKKEVNGNEFNL